MASIDDLLKKVGALHDDLQSLRSVMEGSSQTATGMLGKIRNLDSGLSKLSTTSSRLARDIEASTDSIREQSKSLEENKSKTEDTLAAHEKLTKVGKIASSTMISMGGSMVKASTGAVFYNKAIRGLANVFDSAFKQTSEYEYAVYKVTDSIRAASGSMMSARQAQEAYNARIEKMKSTTQTLSTPEVERTFSNLVQGFDGIRDAAQLDSFQRITTGVMRYTQNAEEAAKRTQSLVEQMNQYAEVQRLFDSASQGEFDESLATTLGLAGIVDTATIREASRMAQSNVEDRESGDAGGAFGRYATTQAQMRESEFQINREITQTEVAQATMDTAKYLSSMVEINKGILANTSAMIGLLAPVGAGITSIGLGIGGLANTLSVGARGAGMVKGVFSGGAAVKAAAGSVDDVARSAGMLGTIGRGGRLLSGGMRAAGRFLGPIGLLLSGGAVGYGAYNEARDAGMGGWGALGQGAMAGGLNLGGALSGATAGAAIGAFGGPIGMLLGGLIGGVGGSFGGDAIFNKFFKSDKIKSQSEEVKKESERQKSVNEAIQNTGITGEVTPLIEQMNELNRTFAAFRQITGSLDQSLSSLASSFSSGAGFAKELASIYRQQADISSINIQILKRELDIKRQNEADAEKKYQKEIQRINNDPSLTLIQRNQQLQVAENDLFKASALVRQKESEIMSESIKRVDLLVASRTAEIDQILKGVQADTSYTQALRDLHEQQRLGIGISYRDQVAVVKQLASETQLLKQRADAIRTASEQASVAGDTEMATRLSVQARQAETEAIRKETEMYREAKAMREGYLDAFRQEMSATGGYAELVASADFGVQNLESTMRYGGFLPGARGVMQPGRFTTAGPSVGGELLFGPNGQMRGGAYDAYGGIAHQLNPDHFDFQNMVASGLGNVGGIEAMRQEGVGMSFGNVGGIEAMRQEGVGMSFGNLGDMIKKSNDDSTSELKKNNQKVDNTNNLLRTMAERGTEGNPTYVKGIGNVGASAEERSINPPRKTKGKMGKAGGGSPYGGTAGVGSEEMVFHPALGEVPLSALNLPKYDEPVEIQYYDQHPDANKDWEGFRASVMETRRQNKNRNIAIVGDDHMSKAAQLISQGANLIATSGDSQVRNTIDNGDMVTG